MIQVSILCTTSILPGNVYLCTLELYQDSEKPTLTTLAYSSMRNEEFENKEFLARKTEEKNEKM